MGKPQTAMSARAVLLAVATLAVVLAVSDAQVAYPGHVATQAKASTASAPAAAPTKQFGSGSRSGKPTVVYKMPREGERIPRSKGVYVEFHIDNHREGIHWKFFFRSQEMIPPNPHSNMFGFEYPQAPPGFYTVRVELYDENNKLLQVKPRRFMVY